MCSKRRVMACKQRRSEQAWVAWVEAREREGGRAGRRRAVHSGMAVMHCGPARHDVTADKEAALIII